MVLTIMLLSKHNIGIISFLYCFTGIAPSAFSQRSICLQDIGSRKPIQYANIYIGNAVYYTNVHGHLDIPDTVSSLKICHICYVDTTIILPNIKENIIYMLPKIYEIPEVVVVNKSNYKHEQVGPIRKKEHLFFGGRSGLYIGVFIPYKMDYENKVINSIVTDLYNNKTLIHGSYEKNENAVLRFDLRLPDSQTNVPSSYSMIQGGIIVDDISDGHKIIPLVHPISFPHSGIFVIIEWIVKGECKENIIYNPHIRMSKSDKSSVSWLKREYRQENWVNWNMDEGMRQLQKNITEKYINANIGILLSE